MHKVEIHKNPNARGIAGGEPASYMLVKVNRDNPFPVKTVISNHKSMEAAEKALSKYCRVCGAGPLHPNRQPACHECGS